MLARAMGTPGPGTYSLSVFPLGQGWLLPAVGGRPRSNSTSYLQQCYSQVISEVEVSWQTASSSGGAAAETTKNRRKKGTRGQGRNGLAGLDFAPSGYPLGTQGHGGSVRCLGCGSEVVSDQGIRLARREGLEPPTF